MTTEIPKNKCILQVIHLFEPETQAFIRMIYNEDHIRFYRHFVDGDCNNYQSSNLKLVSERMLMKHPEWVCDVTLPVKIKNRITNRFWDIRFPMSKKSAIKITKPVECKVDS